ncbi:acyltransferase family protein, partial [Pseudoalteromonas sp. S554]|uniref:acyltransferase family protein n=1 Tax=Pseudoalteromonas sp. S554 TaxID=2066516 RepID=UPI00110D09EC
MHFREDINGLRAIAVIAVVLFHFNPSWMPGGFAGVDVFFVISGFLMTGIIFKGLEQQNFSIIKFYISRANRIIPALAILCIVLLIFGWFFLSPVDYKSLAKHAVSSIGFISNNIYWLESGYFDTASHEKWLLHTWSLSVEWQFYILYPILLVICNKLIGLTWTKKIILIGTLLGFAFCVIATYKWPSSSYFLFPARAWEMMIGGVAYLYPISVNRKQSKALEIIGITFIVASYLIITKHTPWPGYLALFPVLGSFLIIQANAKNSLITNNFVFQKVGSWSYSIYLWHWPLVVAITYFSLNSNFIYLGITLSILLGYFSSKYIEKLKFHRSFTSINDLFKYKPLLIAIITSTVGVFLYTTNGYEQHYPNDVIKASNEASNKNPYKCITASELTCYIGNKTNVKAIIVGDSHADAVTTSLASIFELDKEGIIAITKSACPFIMNALSTKNGDECFIENNKRIKFLKENYKHVPVFWAARTGAYVYGQSNPKRINSILDTEPSIYFSIPQSTLNELLYEEIETNLKLTINELAKTHPVYILQPVPEMRKNIPKTLSKNILLNSESPRV